MAKELTFTIESNEYSFEPLKLERSKLYGWSEKEILDDKENKCILGTLVPEFSMILTKGGMSLGALNVKGEWVEKSDVKYIYEDGLDAKLVPSSFDSPIKLSSTVPIEKLLEHNITSVYSLQGEENHPAFVVENEREI